jgi:hypothetical protein
MHGAAETQQEKDEHDGTERRHEGGWNKAHGIRTKSRVATVLLVRSDCGKLRA